MKPGDIVKVRLYGGAIEPRRFIRQYPTRRGRVVVICHETEWRDAIEEDRDPRGLGFPFEDIIAND